MKPFPPSELLFLAALLARYEEWMKPEGQKSQWPDGAISADAAVIFDIGFSKWERLCEDLDLDAAASTIQKIRKRLNPNWQYHHIWEFADELSGRLRDQMDRRKYLALSPTETREYEHPLEGWEKILEQFPAATTDVEEANKCLAVDRYTAAVFHALQIAEAGVVALGRVVKVTDPKEGWGPTRAALKKIIDAGYAKSTPWQQKHWTFFEQTNATLEVLQNAWRNKVSHMQGRLALQLGSEFAPDVARDILSATRSFMRRLATEMPALEEPFS